MTHHHFPLPAARDPDAKELPERLHFEGSRMMKPNGKEIVLRGPCFGSWGEDTPDDAAPVKAMAANSVRVNLKWWRPGDADSRDDRGFAFLLRKNIEHWLSMIDAVIAQGMWVIPCVDSDCGQNGLQDAETVAYCDPYGMWPQGHNFFLDPSMRRTYAGIVWPTLATALRMRERIAMLELQPEPAGGRGPEYAPLVQQLYREIIAGIREVDQDTPFLIGARNSYDIMLCDEAYLPERTDVAYTGNLLAQWVKNPEKFDKGLAALVAMRDARNVPIYCQQLGRRSSDDRDCSLLRRAVQKAREARMGYAYWEWKNHVKDNPDSYGLNYPTKDGAWIRKDAECAALQEDWQA